MLVVKLLNLLLGDADMRADFLLNDSLRDDAVLQVLFEFLEGDTLRLRRLLQVFHGFRVHLLAQLVEALDYIGVGTDPEFLGLLREQLGVNQIAKQVLLLRLVLRRNAGVRLALLQPLTALRCASDPSGK